MNTHQSLLKDIAVCFALIIFAFCFTSVSANDTMDILKAGKRLQITTASGAVVIITFSANGQYQTNTGSSGTWRIEGDVLCTTRAQDGIQSCGSLPDGKGLGDSWATKDGNGEPVTAMII